MEPKVIKTAADHKTALAELARLMNLDPASGSPEFCQLEVLSVLIEDYEKRTFVINLPDPIEAIKFRLDQLGKTSQDLVPIIGSRSKVSEVLRKKRPLSLRMIRALHKELGIPTEVLLQEVNVVIPDESEIQWESFPLVEMKKFGWFDDCRDLAMNLKDNAEELIRKSYENLINNCAEPVLARTSAGNYRLRRDIDIYSLVIWQAKIVELALQNPLPMKYSEPIGEEFLGLVAQQTKFNNGPAQARELLNNYGIHLVHVPHFSRTYLDGGVLILKSGTPVIGLTLRHDRLDNFWFTLIHELAHLVKHMGKKKEPIFDDFESGEISQLEKEADELAENVLLPNWSVDDSLRAEKFYSIDQLKFEARKRNIHVAILAGRVQHDTKKYQKYRSLLGNKEPSKCLGKNDNN